MATYRYNRSEVYSFFDLSESDQAELIEGLDSVDDASEIEEIENASYVALNFPDGQRFYSLAECMRTDGGRFDGVIGLTNTSANGVKLSRCGTEAVVALIG